MAGLLLGVLPIASWVMTTSLSKFSIPFTSLQAPGISLERYNLLAIVLQRISLTRVLLPLPETPVTHINFPKGNLTFIFFKLF